MRKDINVVSYDKKEYPTSNIGGVLEIQSDKEISNQDELVAALHLYPFMYEDQTSNAFSWNGFLNFNANISKFRIDIFDNYGEDDIPFLEYLSYDKSNYRVTRLSDGAIIRLSDDDYKNYLAKVTASNGLEQGRSDNPPKEGNKVLVKNNKPQNKGN